MKTHARALAGMALASGRRDSTCPRRSRPRGQKAPALNLDNSWYGTIAEIGAGQEVARWFFAVGGAAGTVAKTISAYDMTVSDGLYGKSQRYVSRERLEQMLEHEYASLLQSLGPARGATSSFFVFADTVATRSYARPGDGEGWLGITFQHQPGGEPSRILLHTRLLDPETKGQQEAVGLLGVNLVYAAWQAARGPAMPSCRAWVSSLAGPARGGLRGRLGAGVRRRGRPPAEPGARAEQADPRRGVRGRRTPRRGEPRAALTSGRLRPAGRLPARA